MKKFVAVILVLVFLANVAACSQTQTTNLPPANTTTSTLPEKPSLSKDNEGYKIPNLVVPGPEKFSTKGPDGDIPVWYDRLELTPEEVAKVREMNARVVYEMPNQSEFSQATMRGFVSTCEFLNMEIVGEAFCENDPALQKENMENFMALKIDGLAAQAQEQDIAAPTFDPLVEAGVKIAFQANVPTGYKHNKEYVSASCADIYSYGVLAADALAEAIDYKGKVAIIKLSAVNFVSNIRDGAFCDTIREKYPDIELVEETGIEKSTDAGPAASALLTRYPDLDGLHVTFAEPCVEALEVVRSLGMKDLKITTIDFDTLCALDMINEGNICAIVVNRPIATGQILATLIAYGLLEKETESSAYASPIVTVKADEIESAWMYSFGQELPAELKAAINEKNK